MKRAFNTIQNQLKSLYHFQKPLSIEEANSWLKNYPIHYNSLPHRREKHSRLEDWQSNLPQEGYRQMCSWERFCQMARHPDERLVNASACISIEGVRYQLIEGMSSEKVLVLVSLFDNELYVEFHDQRYGPFYQVEGPILINTYRAFKKTSIERRIDKISAIAKQISLPKSDFLGNQAMS